MEKEITVSMDQILHAYYADNAQKLRMIVDRILLKFGGWTDKDRDDFYSLANEVFADVMKRYDRKQSFDGLLYSCLCNRIKTEMTRRNRDKRSADRMSVSMDAPMECEENLTLGDVLVDSFRMEEAVCEGKEEEFSEKTKRYLSRLSNIQKEVLRLTSEGYAPGEIQTALHITGREYQDCFRAIHSYRNVSVLF